jgi:hypothetical protein
MCPELRDAQSLLDIVVERGVPGVNAFLGSSGACRVINTFVLGNMVGGVRTGKVDHAPWKIIQAEPAHPWDNDGKIGYAIIPYLLDDPNTF